MKAARILGLVLALVLPVSPTPAGTPSPESEAAGAMCTTHGVLEAVCTKCKPRLATIFKAKGDWCAAHDFPGSFCPTCHPALGGKPVGDISSDGAPPDGLKVRLRSPETARLAGIQTVMVAARPARTMVSAVLQISYDATRVAAVTALAAGVIRVLVADVGTTVRAGGALGVIESASTRADRSRLDAATARLTVAGAHRDRERSLNAQGIAAKKDLLTAQQEWAAAKAEVDAARAALEMAGDVGPGGRTTLVSPLTGVVTQRKATVGRLVDTADVLFEVIDTSTMWADLDIPETDIGEVRTGQTVEIAIDGLAGRTYPGRLSYLAPSVDRETRTIRGRVVLANPAGELRANMFGQARILVGQARTAIVVPRSAVQLVREVALVFVRRSDSEYETRRVQLGQRNEDTIDVLKGLAAGEQVVTVGSFLLKTETLKGSIGAGCCEADVKK